MAAHAAEEAAAHIKAAAAAAANKAEIEIEEVDKIVRNCINTSYQNKIQATQSRREYELIDHQIAAFPLNNFNYDELFKIRVAVPRYRVRFSESY